LPLPLKLLVEGWRHIAHSYAIVNQWQLLALSRRADVMLRTGDRPYFGPQWRPVQGLFDPALEQALSRVASPADGFRPDATLRITFPYDFVAAPAGITAVFGTAEHQVVPRSYLASRLALRRARDNPRIMVITPSNWSARGFYGLGFPAARVAIVPHGVDTAIFRPDPERRLAVRQQLGLSGFTFFHAGAMTWNKGVDLLLRAFAAVAKTNPSTRLILKGVDDVYNSSGMLEQELRGLSTAHRAALGDRIIYESGSVSMRRMASLYLAADAYVTPYRGEGFNIPVLEAMACGLPVVCTAGGATEDFISPAVARTIRSEAVAMDTEGEVGRVLAPDLDHLIKLMQQAMTDDAWRTAAASAGPAHVGAYYTWDRVADRLVNVLQRAR
jgi:glycosyltransferase involved in cell wall biosynthesis